MREVWLAGLPIVKQAGRRWRMDEQDVQAIREVVFALELAAEESLVEKGLLDRDIDALSDE
jgi:hypothetical protein